ncbi:hypothetical protein BGZ95_000251 [Linnemannia exigua]|uniref:F-box domain-containing protein n=1 Tax=Linnemannia exigua TaxID=604196 RepID=A0AAD4D8I8_9FUNG|nr:hypothetical protein BGZ95_000251 [Linnemannia exigua]
MSTLERTSNPLELPEILTRVAYYLSPWEKLPSRFSGQLETEFKPKSVLACMQVSKLWHQIMLPVLWQSYSGHYFVKAPLKLIHKRSPFFRYFRSFQGHEGPYQCTSLVDLNMSQHSKTSHGNGIDIETQNDLVAANRDLRKLYWHGPSKLVPMYVESLARLRRIDDLMLLCWQGHNGQLSEILRAVAGTVTRLGLYSIHGVAEGALMVDSGNGIKEQLVLPHVIKLAYRINHKESSGLEELVRCCPNLKKLYIIPEVTYDMTRLTKNIQECCPNLEALTVKYVELDDEDFVALLYGCRRGGPGLVRLRMNVHGLSDALTNAILGHSATLQSIKLDVRTYSTLDVKNLLRILMECRQLWRFDLQGCSRGTTADLQSVLKSQTWGCKCLEFLGLSISPPLLPVLPVGDNDGNTTEMDGNTGDNDNGEGDDDDYSILSMESVEQTAETEEEKEARLESKAKMLASMGWQVGKQISNHHEGVAKKQGQEDVAAVVGLVEGLERVKVVQWNCVRYERMT